MTTETEWGVQFDRPGEALIVQTCCNNEADAREMAAAYTAIGVKAETVARYVSYSAWERRP